MSTVVGRNMARKLKIGENEKHPLDDLKMTQITKNAKKRNAILKDLEYGEKLKITENEKYNTLQDGNMAARKTEKGGKFQKCPLQDGNMARKLKIGK